MLDFRKYLNCPECRQRPPYCPEHRKEVNSILEESQDQVLKNEE
jgi:hypothetical protein